MASADDFTDLIARLLPPGALLQGDGQGEGAARRVIGRALARLQEAAAQLVEELDPTTATDLIDAWIRVLYPAGSTAATLEAKRAAAQAQLLAQGAGYGGRELAQIVRAAGYPDLEFHHAELFRLDEGHADDRLYDQTWAFVLFVVQDPAPAEGWAEILARLRAAAAAYILIIALTDDPNEYGA